MGEVRQNADPRRHKSGGERTEKAMAGYTVIQKDRTRYTFIVGEYYTVIGCKRIPSGKPRYSVHVEQLLTSGGSLVMNDTTKEAGNRLYKELIAKGYKQFRNAREVSWYATIENNTPYDEEWSTEGKYLIPIRSRVLD